MKTQMYIITAKTHLHAGSGNSNAGVIDNLVQRDPADNLPCIYSSSLKGAFREFFEEGPVKDKKMADEIFGEGDNKGSKGMKKGSHIFHQASLLSIPARSNVKLFYHATCKSVLEKFIEDSELFNIDVIALRKEVEELPKLDKKTLIIGNKMDNMQIEDYFIFDEYKTDVPNLKKLLSTDIVIFSDEDFKDLCSDYNLPVIARNNLENGQSKNLWYEQIVPRQAKFYFFTARNCDTDNFDTHVNGNNVQIGANASIGYGVCTISNFKSE
ncbi:MAG: type III-B CRISPR module RAMP protein Cmr4 [Bacteroidales bacterium]|nr:type III-B CRISPR module RAMP protein Cmr4 [Bacteroidales bacterium]